MMDPILIKYLLGEATAGERARVDQWLSADSRNRERYEQIKTVWETSRQSAPPVIPDPQEALGRLRQRVPTRTTVVRKIRPAARPSRDGRLFVIGSRRWLVAAGLIGLIMAGAVIFVGSRGSHVMKSQSEGHLFDKDVRSHTAPTGESSSIARSSALPVFPASQAVSGWLFRKATDSVKEMVLPDSSVVTLNRGGQLAWSKILRNNERVVSLRGEAFFAIAPDLVHPFIVRVGDVTLQVLGTSFNVREGPDGIEVIVETGAVRVSRGKENVVAHPGEKIMAARKDEKLSLSVNNDPFYGYYLDRPLVCDSVPMERVVEMLNKAYDAHIVITSDKLAGQPLTTVFRHAPLEKVLEMLSATMDFEVVQKGEMIILK